VTELNVDGLPNCHNCVSLQCEFTVLESRSEMTASVPAMARHVGTRRMPRAGLAVTSRRTARTGHLGTAAGEVA